MQASVWALSTPSEAGQTFNVGSGISVRKSDIAHAQGPAIKLASQLGSFGEFRVGAIFAWPTRSGAFALPPRFQVSARRDSGGVEVFMGWAARQTFEKAYDKVVSELCAPPPVWLGMPVVRLARDPSVPTPSRDR